MIGALVGSLLATALLAQKVEPLERVGRLGAPAIREASGLVASRRYPGIFWVHNDSQNAPELFAVRGDGELVRAYKVAVPNIDWEDITTDDSGHLYLADTGNNDLVLPVRVIHKLLEPDPTLPATSKKPLAVLASSYYKFASGQKFDAEALFVSGPEAYVVTKRRDQQPAEVYRITLDPPSSLFRPSTPVRVGLLAGCVEPVTGASLTQDGQTLAVVTDRSVRVFRSPNLNDWAPVAVIPFRAADVEAITWSGADLLLASEDRSLYRVAAARWRSTSGAPR